MEHKKDLFLLMVSEVSGPMHAESGMGAVDKAAHLKVGRKQRMGVPGAQCAL